MKDFIDSQIDLDYEFMGALNELLYSKLIKVGDEIEWSFGVNELVSDRLRNKTFSANVVIINERERTYGVYAEYGQDLIPFDKAKKV